MKIKLLFLISCLLGATAFSQIPNSGFETWGNNNESGHSYQLPIHWISEDMISNSFNPSYTGISSSQSSQSYSGNYAIKLETAINNGDTVGGGIYSCDSLTQLFQSWGWIGSKAAGFPYSGRPANLQGYFKSSLVGNDSIRMVVVLSKWNPTTQMIDFVGECVSYFGGNSSSYTQFNLPITYNYNIIPDTAYIEIGLRGANGKKTHVGSVVHIDALSFSGNVPIGINEITKENKSVKLYPNPFASSATITIDPTVKLNMANLIVYNVLGEEIRTINNINNNTITLEKDDMSSGVYFYKLVNSNSEIATGKFIIE